MDDLGFNKIAGAVLATGLGMLLLMKLPGLVMADSGEVIAYKVGPIAVPDGNAAPVDLPFPQQSWVDAMDAAKGAKVFKKCKSCHNVDPGGANGTGPALHGVVGNDIGAVGGFKFSTALTGIEGNWTYEALDAFLKKPSKYAPGTKMNFVGLKKDEDRAAVIEYLRVADASPEVKPSPAAAEGEMMKDGMAPESMEKDAMVDEGTAPDTMEKETMEKKEVIKETMEKVETPE
jgi:cytochrome c